MKEERQPKPQSNSPPPRPPRGPTVAMAFGDDDEPERDRKKEVRISLPPKPVTTIELPTLPAAGPTLAPATSIPKKAPWWKFWK